MSNEVIIKDAVKRYGDFTALNGVSVNIREGEFFTLLGPSGCGKTTLLRMIAGFNSIEGGDFYFGEKRINDVAAHKRDIGMVFQNYAIFPHLTVRENVAYGLKARKTPKAEMDKRVEEALELVQISHLADRKPNELSGGQQQRVALARAFVIEPSVLLMDEPLSNLDAKLRVQMRTVIKKLQRRLGITTIYVTHDQEEALAISDRIAVMKDGHIMQIGTTNEIYAKPQNHVLFLSVPSHSGRSFWQLFSLYPLPPDHLPYPGTRHILQMRSLSHAPLPVPLRRYESHLPAWKNHDHTPHGASWKPAPSMQKFQSFCCRSPHEQRLP